MHRAVELAISHAVGLARMRTGRLASVTIEGPVDSATDLVAAARHALAGHAIVDVDVHLQVGTGVRLAAIEIVPGDAVHRTR